MYTEQAVKELFLSLSSFAYFLGYGWNISENKIST